MKILSREVVATVVIAGCAFALVAGQQPAPAPVFSAQQADAGRAAYDASCAGCHLPDLAGMKRLSWPEATS
jgi:mono/diheme cytochrome c family protein